jgi:hypothetical protein
MHSIEHIRHDRGELYRVRDGGDGERLAKIVMPSMAKGRPVAPARTAARPAPASPANIRAAALASLQHATRHALEVAKAATTALKFAKQAATPSELARAEIDARIAHANLERERDREESLSAMKKALARPVRIA